MTEKELNALCGFISEKTIDLYATLCQKIPKPVVLTGLSGALAACATEAGFPREKVLAAINSAFDDIESEEL